MSELAVLLLVSIVLTALYYIGNDDDFDDSNPV